MCSAGEGWGFTPTSGPGKNTQGSLASLPENLLNKPKFFDIQDGDIIALSRDSRSSRLWM
jgi:hypothetical protein